MAVPTTTRRGRGAVEPSDTRVLVMRVFGGSFVLVGLGIFLGPFP